MVLVVAFEGCGPFCENCRKTPGSALFYENVRKTLGSVQLERPERTIKDNRRTASISQHFTGIYQQLERPGNSTNVNRAHRSQP